MNDLISRQAIMKEFSEFVKRSNNSDFAQTPTWNDAVSLVGSMPSAQQKICEGCKHLGKWENEVEYGYPSPCTRCKRRVEDHYER